jgi:hypothetical protein
MTIADESQRVSRVGWPKAKALCELRTEPLGESDVRHSGTINEAANRTNLALKKRLDIIVS